MTYKKKNSFPPNQTQASQALRNLEKCIADINAWMNSNSLQLNHSKCEFMLFGSKSQLNKLDIDSISISGNDIPLSNSCRNLGVIFDSQMSMSKQTTSICKSVRYTVCLKKNYTLLKWLPNEKYLILGRMIYMYG